MHYRRFEFRNFKGIREMTVDLAGDVTTLIGLNESGKTTILEAIYCFSYGAEDLEAINPEMASLRLQERWIPISRRANFNEEIVIAATVVLSDDDREAFRQHMRDDFGLRLVDVPAEIRIAEHHKFQKSRYMNTTRYWSLSFTGTTGRQRTPRSYGANDQDEWNGAVKYLQNSAPTDLVLPELPLRTPRALRP